ncbi:MAG: DNA/RNA non-specific endonuclease [Clostridia bacterium]|nr:DNA/RNA non-specific endonuclease [Clostridia bacterium]
MPAEQITLEEIPAYNGDAYVVLYDNQPLFTEREITTRSYEHYAPLDALGRCTVASACLSRELMPTEERGDIGMIKPSGWVTAKYDHVDGQYLYNRCHLIGFQLSGENANECNLITGTRYMNVDGMLPFENMVADFIKETGYHVLYRVTPLFEGNELVARGVQMEALSVEDGGEGICFHVFCYNVQPHVVIDYATGHSYDAADIELVGDANALYILNTSSKKIHKPSCASVKDVLAKNRKEWRGLPETLFAEGYEVCHACF